MSSEFFDCGFYLLHSMELEEICRVCVLPSAFWNITLNIKRALVLFFLALASPILCSTSAFLSFNIPTLSTLQRKCGNTSVIDLAQVINYNFLVSFQHPVHSFFTLLSTLQVVCIITYDTLLSVADFMFISITVVPSMSLSLQGVEFFPQTLQAWQKPCGFTLPESFPTNTHRTAESTLPFS